MYFTVKAVVVTGHFFHPMGETSGMMYFTVKAGVVTGHFLHPMGETSTLEWDEALGHCLS